MEYLPFLTGQAHICFFVVGCMKDSTSSARQNSKEVVDILCFIIRLKYFQHFKMYKN